LDRVRRSVAPSLLTHLAHNRRQRAEVRLFEIGKGYLPEHANERGEPRERHECALVWLAPWVHPGRCLSAELAGSTSQEPVVLVAALEPEVQTRLELRGELDGEVVVASIDLDRVLA